MITWREFLILLIVVMVLAFGDLASGVPACG